MTSDEFSDASLPEAIGRLTRCLSTKGVVEVLAATDQIQQDVVEAVCELLPKARIAVLESDPLLEVPEPAAHFNGAPGRKMRLEDAVLEFLRFKMDVYVVRVSGVGSVRLGEELSSLVAAGYGLLYLGPHSLGLELGERAERALSLVYVLPPTTPVGPRSRPSGLA